jgi:hypothetical protein
MSRKCLPQVRGLAQTIRAWHFGHRRAGHHEVIVGEARHYMHSVGQIPCVRHGQHERMSVVVWVLA